MISPPRGSTAFFVRNHDADAIPRRKHDWHKKTPRLTCTRAHRTGKDMFYKSERKVRARQLSPLFPQPRVAQLQTCTAVLSHDRSADAGCFALLCSAQDKQRPTNKNAIDSDAAERGRHAAMPPCLPNAPRPTTTVGNWAAAGTRSR